MFLNSTIINIKATYWLMRKQFFIDWFWPFLCFGCFWGALGLCKPAYCEHSGAVSTGKVYGCGFGCWRYGQGTGDVWHWTLGTWHMTQPTHDILHNPHMPHDTWQMNTLEKSSSFHFLKKFFFWGIGASTCTQREIHCLHCAGLSLGQKVALVVVTFFSPLFKRTFLCAQLLLDPFLGLSLIRSTVPCQLKWVERIVSCLSLLPLLVRL